MSSKTIIACLQGKRGRHRLTRVKYIKKMQRCLVAEAKKQKAVSEREKTQKKVPKRAESVGKAARKPGTYRRIGSDDRIRIETLRKHGLTNAEIARELGYDRSTIGREIKRNSGKRGYRHAKAQRRADFRANAKATARRKFTDAMWTRAKEALGKDWTFEQFSGRERREGRACVCKETFYKEYYARQEQVRRGELDEVLPVLPRRRKIRKTRDRNAKKYRQTGRGRIPGRVDIDERPREIMSRSRIGHWEGDLINGQHGTGNLVTVVERMSRFTLVGFVATKESDTVMKTIEKLLSELAPEVLKTLTFDNGKEFALFGALKKALGIDVYFAHPYHSWERGTNENRNGIVRRVLPKGTSFESLTDEQMARIDRMLNDRPMKCLGWRTPREVFMARVAYHMKTA